MSQPSPDSLFPSENVALAHALFGEGVSAMSAGKIAEAQECFRRAIALMPTLAEAHGNLGFLLDMQGRSADAEESYREALRLNPGSVQTLGNLGALLASQRRLAEAKALHEHAIRISPDDPRGWSNLGVVCACEKEESEAEACYRRALELDETHRSARFNLSYVLLRQGRFEEGWACYEARESYDVFVPMLSIPRWFGEPLDGKSILLIWEGGHGDTMQFSRYAVALKARGAKVALLCHPAMKNLLLALDGADRIFGYGDAIAETDFDFWSPLMSLPYVFGTRADSVPAPIPYLHASETDIARWAQRMPTAKLRVGLAWQGTPKFENDTARSIAQLATLAPLWSVPDVAFVSLQKVLSEDDAQLITQIDAITNPGPELADFTDTAAVIASLDLVICVDTSVAHLAGALGKPCWLLLPDFKPDWRWLADRDDSPWYPDGMRLFRQTISDDWASVIERVVVALKERVHGLTR